MRILGICSSPKGSRSTTLRLVQAALEGAGENGAETELVDLCQLDIKYCNACQTCFKTGKCVHKDDFQGLYEKILMADGLILGSPNYFHTVTAQLKTLIDRQVLLQPGHRRQQLRPGHWLSGQLDGQLRRFCYRQRRS